MQECLAHHQTGQVEATQGHGYLAKPSASCNCCLKQMLLLFSR